MLRPCQGGYRCRPSEIQTLSRRHSGRFWCRCRNFINVAFLFPWCHCFKAMSPVGIYPIRASVFGFRGGQQRLFFFFWFPEYKRCSGARFFSWKHNKWFEENDCTFTIVWKRFLGRDKRGCAEDTNCSNKRGNSQTKISRINCSWLLGKKGGKFLN